MLNFTACQISPHAIFHHVPDPRAFLPGDPFLSIVFPLKTGAVQTFFLRKIRKRRPKKTEAGRSHRYAVHTGFTLKAGCSYISSPFAAWRPQERPKVMAVPWEVATTGATGYSQA